MPAKKKAKRKPVKKIKVKHLTNALYWSIKIQTRVRAMLLAFDPNDLVPISAMTTVANDQNNVPRVFSCPPSSK